MTNAEALMRKGKKGAAAFVQAECSAAAASEASNSTNEEQPRPEHLNALLDRLLHPEKNIDDVETIEWCQSLVGGGKSYEEFAKCVKEYDSTAMCGLVWTANFMAYRCRTCQISRCMSLCAVCFKNGDHQGHDFNMFKSQAGGACDCGDAAVMRPSGFCARHHGGCNQPVRPPKDLMCVAENLIPRIFLRLVQHLRIHSPPSSLTGEAALQTYELVITNATNFLKLIHNFASLGSAMRTVMTRCLVDPLVYEKLMTTDSEFMKKSHTLYREALENLPNPDPPAELADLAALSAPLLHCSFLEELVFWTVKYEFPEKLVCLLLKMLPDTEYKESFTKCFVVHYSRISKMLVRSSDSDKLSNRIVHVSVQVFSNEDLALSMTENYYLLHIMVSSLKNMMNNVLVQSRLNYSKSEDASADRHYVVDCSEHVMEHHCYWPLVSDLNNVLSHSPIAFRFMADNTLLTMWFDFLKTFQGMNLNVRIVGQHVEFEPNTYYASFSGELEASAAPMWALVSHIKNPNVDPQYTRNVITLCLRAIQEWMELISFRHPSQIDPQKVSFHLPLHRYYSVFLRQAVKHQGFSLKELLPHPYMISLLMMHPLRVQTAFYEIMSGLWVRNGLQIKGQAMTYIQCHFCKSMVDADLFLLQVCATQLPANTVLKTIIESFQITDWLSFNSDKGNNDGQAHWYRDRGQELHMIDSCLVFLVSLMSLRTNLGLDEEQLSKLEMVSLLCMGDRTHSSLHDQMPEKYGTILPLELFDRVLSEVAQYSEPRFEPGGNMQQGIYVPKPQVWENLYDPIYVLLRAVHRREFMTSMDRYSVFARTHKPSNRKLSPWPPWRIPIETDAGFDDPRILLHSKYAHGLIFNLLYKAVHGSLVNDSITSIIIHLLELAITFPHQVTNPVVERKQGENQAVDLNYDTWYTTDCLADNIKHRISVIYYNSSSHTMEIDEMDPASDTESYKVDQDPPLAITQEVPAEEDINMESSAVVLLPRGLTQGAGSSTSSTSRLVKPRDIPANEKKKAVRINESIISLLLQLHSKYYGRPNSYVPLSKRSATTTGREYRESRVGDACFFIEKVLDRICEMDGESSMAVEDSIRQLWPGTKPAEMADSSGDDEQEMAAKKRRQRAREHQKKVMEQLAAQRKRFMESCGEGASSGTGGNGGGNSAASSGFENRTVIIEDVKMEEEMEETVSRANEVKEYTCCHCLLQQPASEEKPIGLVTLIQPTSVLAHRNLNLNKKNLVLPTTTEEEDALPSALMQSLGQENDRVFESLSSSFSRKMALGVMNRGVRTGVHIQSCGHHMHYDCRQSYCDTLHKQQSSRIYRNPPLDTDEKSEFICPVCRQMANSLLPIPPEENSLSLTMFPHNEQERMNAIAKSIYELLQEDTIDVTPGGSPLRVEMAKIVEFVTKTTYGSSAQQFQLNNIGLSSFYDNHVVMNVLSSIARTNLELDLIQRGGDLVQHQGAAAVGASSSDAFATNSSQALSKTKLCLGPLMHVLSIHMKVISPDVMFEGWGMLTGHWYQTSSYSSSPDGSSDYKSTRSNDIPLLLRDPVTLLLNYFLLLPFNVDIAYFLTVVKACYNLRLTQTLVHLTSGMTADQRKQLPKDHALGGYVCQIVRQLESTGFYLECTGTEVDNSDIDRIEETSQRSLLPYLRICSLIKHYIFQQPLPKITEEFAEFSKLAEYLELVPIPALKPKEQPKYDEEMSRLSQKSTSCLAAAGYNWFSGGGKEIEHWLQELWVQCMQCTGGLQVARGVGSSCSTSYAQPGLLGLPKNFEQIFQFYHKAKCRQCDRVPKDPTVCLMCGTLVCLKEECCRKGTTGQCETVAHSVECGGGTGIFLAVNSSSIVVIRGKRACIWGSIYLDVFGEEDRDLRRGKPLFLHPERFRLLESQWVTHKFDHTNRKWILHKDTL